jgi:hypothetical protein
LESSTGRRSVQLKMISHRGRFDMVCTKLFANTELYTVKSNDPKKTKPIQVFGLIRCSNLTNPAQGIISGDSGSLLVQKSTGHIVGMCRAADEKGDHGKFHLLP